jgi:hypothetical protein
MIRPLHEIGALAVERIVSEDDIFEASIQSSVVIRLLHASVLIFRRSSLQAAGMLQEIPLTHLDSITTRATTILYSNPSVHVAVLDSSTSRIVQALSNNRWID